MELEEAKERVNKIKGNWHDLLHEKYCYFEDDVEALETVLQELEHLQKENEELKEHNRKYLEAEIFSAKQIKEIEKQRNDHYIHKDKIREKIEKLEYKIRKYSEINAEYYENIADAYAIYILQDLLKEE